ncbi:MAG: aldolase/citrate lyase family protein [Actinobacteria bacterium]|nr:aldolase/citrate lyase family protein [Actinomycetota bacterium]
MMTKEIRAFRDKLKKEAVYGPFSKTNDPAMIEAMGYAGFDFIILDLEHGPNSVETLQNLIRAAQISQVLPIVRVKEKNDSVIGEVLDIGAAGIEVPQISTKEDAEHLVKVAKFAPEGMRGVCRFVRAANYSAMDRFEYFKTANETLIIIHLEGEEAINNIDDLLTVKGIDIMFIGPYDLAQSLGIPGQIDHPLLEEKMKEIIIKCSAKKICVGTFVDNLKNLKKWKNAGIRYISYSVDTGILYECCKNILDNIKN